MQPVTHRCVTSSHVLRVIMTTIMSWQRHPVPVSSTASVGWGSGCRRGTGRSLSWSTMTSSTSRRRGRRSGWRRGRSFFFSREQTTTGGRYVQNIQMPKNSLIEENTHVQKLWIVVSWCPLFKCSKAILDEKTLTGASAGLSPVFSNLEQAERNN